MSKERDYDDVVGMLRRVRIAVSRTAAYKVMADFGGGADQIKLVDPHYYPALYAACVAVLRRAEAEQATRPKAKLIPFPRRDGILS